MLTTLRSVFNETEKELRIAWSYRVDWFVGFITIIGMLLGLMVLFGDDDTDRIASHPELLLGFIISLTAADTLGSLAWRIRNNAQAGTLEQMAMGATGLGALTLGGMLSTQLILLFQFALASAITVVVMNFALPVGLDSLLVLAITLVGLSGFGLMLAGLTAIYKQITALVNITNNILMFANGTFVPIDEFPSGMQPALRLLPTTQGILVLRRVTLDGQSLSAAWQDGNLPFLLAHSAVWFVLGLIVFRMCLNIAKRRGTLSQY